MGTIQSKAAMMMTGLALLACAVGFVGCNKGQEEGTSSSPGSPGDAALISAGKTVFASNGCARCHGTPGQSPGRAPDLTHVGAEAGHTPDWFIQKVKNPKADNPGSRMPSYDGRINDKDLQALGAYLASLK